MERRIKTEYTRARDELTKRFTDFMNTQGAYVNDLQNEYEDLKMMGFDAEARKVGEELGKQKRKLTIYSEKYKEMIDYTTDRLANINQAALDYINGRIPKVYITNYNQMKKDCSKIGVSFSLVDEHTVARRIKDGEIRLPKKKISIPKDKRWNKKNLNSAVIQGILQGESMDDIAKRIYPIVDYNKKAAIRNARTMVTSAENQGRLDSYKSANDRGIVTRKEWVATEDSRTRISHLHLNGEVVDVNKEFSNGLMYPADPNGAGKEVYNCRCTMVSEIVGFKVTGDETVPVDISGTSGKVLNGSHAAERDVTHDLREAVKAGKGHLAGLDFRFKGKGSLERKIIDGSLEKHMTMEVYARRITDALRYTNVSSADNLTSDFFTVKKKLEQKGYQMVQVKNTIWDETAPYRGINTLVETPNGYTFELQFHTPTSLSTKEVNHKLYEEQRLASTSEKRKAELAREMAKNASSIPTPKDSFKIDKKPIDKEPLQW